jgi:lipopolysaccharide transport system permease protein
MGRKEICSIKTMNQKSDGNNTSITVIKPRSGWQIIDFKELNEYRDMFFSMVTRQIKTLYAQTILGFSWAIFKPLIQIVVFTFIFGKVARVSTDGIPYFLFSSVAIIPWTYMSQTMSESSESLVSGQGMLGKIYFPRLVFPLTPVFSRLVDFGFSILIILGILLYYRVLPTWNLLFFPLFLIMMMMIPAGIGLWLSTLAIRFRDVKHAMPFVLQMLIYSAPIVYSASSIPDKYRLLYSLNPIVGVIEGYRACLLGTPIPWIYIGPGIITAVILMISGAFYFRRMERIIVDVI